MEGLREVITSKELFDKKEIELWEWQSFMFQDKTIMRFETLVNTLKFAFPFVHNYLIPNYGKEKAKEFPMKKSGPWRDNDSPLLESMNIRTPDPNQETWLIITTDRYSEVQEYINNLQESTSDSEH